MATFAQLLVDLDHFFQTNELSPLQLFFYGLKNAPFRLSKAALLASFGSDGGHWRLLKEMSEISPAGVSFVS